MDILKHLSRINISVINSTKRDICLNQIYVPEYALQCGHTYHNKCMSEIKINRKHSILDINNINCPYCLSDFGYN